MRVPAWLLAVPFVIGCAGGVLLADAVGTSRPLALACGAVLAAMAAAASLDDPSPAEACVALAIGGLLAGLSLGIMAARNAYRPPLLSWFERAPTAGDPGPLVVEGVLREDAALTDFGASLTVDVASVARPPGAALPLSGGVRLAVGGAAVPAHAGEWRAGRRIRAPAILRLPSTYHNFGLPDERRALARRGIVLVGSVKSASLVEVVRRGSISDEAAGAARAWSRRTLAEHVGRRSERSRGVATAILIGDRTGLPDEDERRLQEAGTYHVIAISGGNIAVLTLLLLGALRAARLPSRPASGVAIASLLFYGQLTGAPASVGRAVTAACVYLAGRMLDQRGPPLNALAIAGLCALAVSPLAALDAGFILSFGATLGILLGAPRMAPGVAPRQPPRPILRRVARAAATAAAAMLAATVSAEVALAPVGAAVFSRITVAGLLLNFAAIPLMTVAQLAALATLAAAPFSPAAASRCGQLTDAAATGLVESARLVDLLPWLARDVAPPAWWLVGVYYACCAWLLVAGRRRAAAACVAASGLAIAAGLPATTRGAVPPRAGVLRAVFLDVGQGDATLLTLPDGRSLLVDAAGLPGTSFDIGSRIVAPSLRALGVRRLDELIVTHGDPDHIGGAPSVARLFRPRVIREGAPVPPHEGLRALAEVARLEGISWRTVQAGDADRVAGVVLTVLHPPLPDWERQRVRNDDSIVLDVRYGDVSILLPGDVGGGTEAAMLPRLASAAPVVILKAAHHGSATSSTADLVRAVRPSAVIVSAGRGNRYGHPAPAVLARFRQAGSAIFRTDEDGAVLVETDGRRVDVRTWSGRVQSFEAVQTTPNSQLPTPNPS